MNYTQLCFIKLRILHFSCFIHSYEEDIKTNTISQLESIWQAQAAVNNIDLKQSGSTDKVEK